MARLSDDEAALLKAVCRSPADDLPRLVYADWLEERGRPERAEFIRLQIEEAREPSSQRDKIPFGWIRRRERIDQLRGDHAAEWLKILPKWAMTLYSGSFLPPFDRGFPIEFELVAAPFLDYGPQLLDRTPIAEIRFEAVAKVVPKMVTCVWLREVPNLDLSSTNLTDEHLLALAEAEWFVGTRKLVLSWNDFGDIGVRALARCRFLTDLRSLHISRSNVTLGGIRALADSPFLLRTRFVLGSCPHLRDQQRAVTQFLGNRVRFSDT